MGVESWPSGGSSAPRAGDTSRSSHRHEYASARPGATPGRDPRTAAGPVIRQGGRGASGPRHRAQRDSRNQMETRGRSSGGPLGDHRGLTAAGGMVLLLLIGGTGAVVDRLLGHGLWVFFSVSFVAAVLLTSARIHLEDLVAAIVEVPLAYAVIGMGTALLSEIGSGSPMKEKFVGAAGVLVFGAPVLLLSVLVAAVITIGRGRAVTLARRRARARVARRYGRPPGNRPVRKAASTGAVRRR